MKRTWGNQGLLTAHTAGGGGGSRPALPLYTMSPRQFYSGIGPMMFRVTHYLGSNS
jgi:hypothetical protein